MAEKARIRRATRADVGELTRLMTRAFARDPLRNWMGSVHQRVASHDSTDPEDLKVMRRLSYFEEAIIKLMLFRGQVEVVVVPKDASGGERIVATTMWLEPEKSADPSFFQLLQLRPWRVARAWGLGGLKRIFYEFPNAVEKVNEKAFSARGMDLKNSWLLVIVATDPDHEGHGYTSMMIRKRLQEIAPTPIRIEASSPRSRDIYAHYGFEVSEELRLGVGRVDELGLKAPKASAPGMPDWVMTKWS